MVLRKREGLEGSVKSVTGLCDFGLVHQKLAIVQPDTRHLRRGRGLEEEEKGEEEEERRGGCRTIDICTI